MKKNLFGAGLVFLTGFSATAFAQSQQDAGALLRQQEQQQRRAAPEPLPADRTDLLKAPLAVEESGSRVLITGLNLSGKTELLSNGDWQSLMDLAVGKRLGIQGLQALAERVTAHLQQQGHLLAFALLPPQDVTDGQVTLEVREGTLETVQINTSDRVRMSEGLLRSIGEKPVRDKASRTNLEEALLRLNDLPGITARGSLAPGEAANTSRLGVRVDEEPLWGFSLHSNNHGVSTTGESQLVGGLSLSDATGYGDYTSVTLSSADGQSYAALGSSVPLGASGISARLQLSQLSYEHVEEPGKTLELEGEARVASLGADYSLIRSRQGNLRFSADLQQKTLEDEMLGVNTGDKQVDAWVLGLAGDLRGGGGVTGLTFRLTSGELDLSGNPDAQAYDAASLQTEGDFRRFNLGLTRYQSLPGNFSLFARYHGQWANKNLDSSEDLSLGGPYGLRGWPVSEAQGDSGMLATLELRYLFPSIVGGQMQLATFVDGGRIRINEEEENDAGLEAVNYNACECNSYNLKSAGLGLDWRGEHLNVSATWATGLGDNPGRNPDTDENVDGDDGKQRFWVQASLVF